MAPTSAVIFNLGGQAFHHELNLNFRVKDKKIFE